ncbi:hypothetical protein, conserved [Eimeria tenella]|uniref:Transmembrane protein n=1 Tax=Eimeria tenella TaxID=5802 RepID=U6KQ27_EIMTE|nr:hypothetical protein, conserved [Eimeria tenella]CDJ37548.1 hypothetical protein, conserved [Eimeria tenella]|eukprot:XP_013228386.1 hypothetical protein, conserved [Eimeria tenella]
MDPDLQRTAITSDPSAPPAVGKHFAENLPALQPSRECSKRRQPYKQRLKPSRRSIHFSWAVLLTVSTVVAIVLSCSRPIYRLREREKVSRRLSEYLQGMDEASLQSLIVDMCLELSEETGLALGIPTTIDATRSLLLGATEEHVLSQSQRGNWGNSSHFIQNTSSPPQFYDAPVPHPGAIMGGMVGQMLWDNAVKEALSILNDDEGPPAEVGDPSMSNGNAFEMRVMQNGSTQNTSSRLSCLPHSVHSSRVTVRDLVWPSHAAYGGTLPAPQNTPCPTGESTQRPEEDDRPRKARIWKSRILRLARQETDPVDGTDEYVEMSFPLNVHLLQPQSLPRTVRWNHTDAERAPQQILEGLVAPSPVSAALCLEEEPAASAAGYSVCKQDEAPSCMVESRRKAPLWRKLQDEDKSTITLTLPSGAIQITPSDHPYYRLPVVETGVQVRKLDSEFCLQNLDQKFVLAVEQLAHIRTYLVRDRIYHNEKVNITLAVERLIVLLLQKHQNGVAQSHPCHAARVLGIRYLIFDAIVATLQLFGPVMEAERWWNVITTLVPTRVAFASSAERQPRSEQYVQLATRLSEALALLKKGVRPSPAHTIALKMALFCHPDGPPYFQGPAWDEWREDHETYIQHKS